MKKRLLFVLFFLILVSACSAGQGFTSTPHLAPTSTLDLTPTQTAIFPTAKVQSETYWPTDGWRTSSPEEQEIDSALLEQMFETIDHIDRVSA